MSGFNPLSYNPATLYAGAFFYSTAYNFALSDDGSGKLVATTTVTLYGPPPPYVPPYVRAHVGAGYVLNLTAQSKLDLHAQYLWSHQDGDTVKLTTGETVKFKDVASQRTPAFNP
ncbi:hypothetical protein AGMMS49960_01900 [Betaproteobacteria bacterium]|nr:hypothetical protein AGMMS49543_21200 [Betaproteobacteria bacterium]GHT98578.1 hypothetical protein AGMMS49960_01900 [Betaproteobacteria bacterium]GHU23475.1 hypothetical protein AGMMS50243_24940 [Betaproteobacteria bacterium]